MFSLPLSLSPFLSLSLPLYPLNRLFMCWCSMMSSIRIALVRQKSNVDKSTKRLHTENCGIKLPLTMSSVASNFMSFGYRFISWASENIVRFATNLGSKAHFPSREKCVHIPSTECNQIKFSDFDWSDASRNDMYSGIGLCQSYSILIRIHFQFIAMMSENALRASTHSWTPDRTILTQYAQTSV